MSGFPKIAALALILLSSAGGLWAQNVRETPVVQVVRDFGPAVVNIGTERIILLRGRPQWGDYGSAFDAFFEDFQRTIVSAFKTHSVGSGVVVRADGLVVTNAHVVHMTSKVFVILKDGTALEADVAGESLPDDLALVTLRVPQPLQAVKLAEPQDVLIGETVVAIGNPYGLENSVTVGVVSGKNRNFSAGDGGPSFTELIQTDAPINPGNSGGALLNLDGELVGINLAVVKEAQNIGFAIPSSKVRAMLESFDRLARKRRVIPIW